MPTRINIAIKPSKEIQEYARKLSQQISKEAEAYFVIDTIEYLPHITIYSPEYPEKNIPAVLDTVEEVTRSLQSFSIAFDSFFSDMGFIGLKCKRSDELMMLHETIVRKLNPLRENHIREKYIKPENASNYAEMQKGYISEYGSPDILTLFNPHLTITRLKNESQAKFMNKMLEVPPFTMNVQTIAAYEMGDHGTCTKIIKEFIFSGF